jgi:pilus assembly protein CpaF
MGLSLRDRLLGRAAAEQPDTGAAVDCHPPAGTTAAAPAATLGPDAVGRPVAPAPKPGAPAAGVDRVTGAPAGIPMPPRAPGSLPPERAATPHPSMTPARGPVTPSRASMSVAATGLPKIGQYAKQIEADAISSVDQIKVELHHRLVERLDLAALERIKDEQTLLVQIRQAVMEFLRGEQAPLSSQERDEIVEQIVYEVTGLGPLEPLFRDPTISDVLVNGPKSVYIERRGKLSRTNVVFRDDAHLLSVIDRIVSRVGRRVDESSPMVDARLPDGSRVNAIIPPLALNGPVLSIRRFGNEITAQELVEKGAMTEPMLALLAGCVMARLNVVISGGTGSGKTTMLNALSSFIPGDERLVTIEDAAELRLQQDHVVRLETRPPNSESRGEVTARDLVKNALRMRPDRIILGEVRGAEALDMLQAMNTGHEGSMGTLHANTAREAISRLETMVLYAGTNLPNKAMRDQISSALDVIVQVSRLSDGSRRVVSITEVTGMEGDVITMQEIYRFARHGIDGQGVVNGRFEPTGVRPQFYERLRVRGVELPPDMFFAR